VTIELIAVGAVFGVALGIFCAWARALGPKWLKPIVAGYVELIRNTPFLIQLFFIFFGLPSIGIQLTEMQGAMLTMVINLGAYSCEIVRAGIQATTRGQFEAGWSLGMTRFETFRYVVLIPSLQRIWPALSSQIVLVMLGSAVVSQIAAETFPLPPTSFSRATSAPSRSISSRPRFISGSRSRFASCCAVWAGGCFPGG
jgi:polar amino acid transport system permease protein